MATPVDLGPVALIGLLDPDDRGADPAAGSDLQTRSYRLERYTVA